MADPSTWTPGNPGDLQPYRTRRGTGEFPSPRACLDYADWGGSGGGPYSYGYSMQTCLMCGHSIVEHPIALSPSAAPHSVGKES